MLARLGQSLFERVHEHRDTRVRNSGNRRVRIRDAARVCRARWAVEAIRGPDRRIKTLNQGVLRSRARQNAA